MTFDDLKIKYAGQECAFPGHFEKPNDSRIIMDLIVNHSCDFPKSFIDFQLTHCHELPMGDFASEGFRWANDTDDHEFSLKVLVEEFRNLGYPGFLTPFGKDDEGYWCFDNGSINALIEPRVVVYVPEQRENAFEHQWPNFIDWLHSTMDENY